MPFLLLTAQIALNEVSQSMDAATVSEAQTQVDIFGWGGILATIVVGVITCIVTWFVTMRTIKQLKLSYNMRIYPILSNAININNPSQADGFKIMYRNKLLENPWLLAVDIENIGNKAIENPPIKISTQEDIQVIPGYFEDIPGGYDDVWEIESDSQRGCKLLLQHINPGQIAHARFYINKQPQKEFRFECPMPDLRLEKNIRSVSKKAIINKSLNPYPIINIALAAIICLFLFTIEVWQYLIGELIYNTHAHIEAWAVILYILAILVLALILNLCRPKGTTLIIKKHKIFMTIASFAMIIISMVLLFLIVYDIFIIYRTPQAVAAIISLLFLSISIHILTMLKS